MSREEFIPPVGFAREPVAERRRWIGRIFLLLIAVALVWLLWNRVIHPPNDNNPPVGNQTTLPAPI